MGDGVPSDLSLLGVPIDHLIEALRKLPEFAGKVFFLLVDEYENYLPYQQQVVNTLVKHAGEAYTFKVGVRQLGWKVRSTLNADQQLMYPADYALIEVEGRLKGDYFKTFAAEVCQSRLDLLARRLSTDVIAVSDLLPSLSEEVEADVLGVDSRIEAIQRELTPVGEVQDELERMPKLQAYFILYWATSHGTNPASEIRDFREIQPGMTRYQNYKHALLYTIRKGQAWYQKILRRLGYITPRLKW